MRIVVVTLCVYCIIVMCAILHVVAYFLCVNLLHIYVHCLCGFMCGTFSCEGIKKFLT